VEVKFVSVTTVPAEASNQRVRNVVSRHCEGGITGQSFVVDKISSLLLSINRDRDGDIVASFFS